MTDAQLVNPEIGVRRPAMDRVWDHQLGVYGVVADAVDAMPDGRAFARENRDFFCRAIRYLAGPAVVRKFVDLGCGYPVRPTVHEIAQQVDPGATALGSLVVATQLTGDARPDLAAVVERYAQGGVDTPPVPRTRQQVAELFAGLDLVEPGLVAPGRWHPDPPAVPEASTGWYHAGVARKAVP